MSENTRQTLEAYLEDLISRDPYRRYFSDEVVLTVMGQDQKPEGPDAVEQMIDYMHQQAFEARPEIKNVVVGDGRAAVEFDFVGKHTGEFAGMAATGRDVRVPYCVVYDLEGEKIKALRLYFPMDELQRQLGDSPTPDRSEEASPT
jgi:predicted ester cyclase